MTLLSRAAALAATVLLAAGATLGAGTLHDAREVHLAEVRQLTFGGDNAEAYWSPSGTELVFQSTRPPFGCDQIFIMPGLEVGEPRLVSSGRGRTTCGYFLNGGRRVLWAATDAYASRCPPPPDFTQGYVWPVDPDYELFAADADGGNRVRLTENRAYDAEATVCPKDGSIVFTSSRDGDLELYRMDADGANVKRLTRTPGYDGGAFFSADCKRLVWRASRPRGAELDDDRRLLESGLVRPSRLELWVADADGENARQITALGAASFAPYFFPSGERIVFSSNYGDPGGREFDLWAIDVDGSDLERITYTASFDGFPIFSPDGKHLAFASNRNQGKPRETDIYVARWVDGAVARSVESAADRFAADVTWLADDAREGRGIGLPGLAEAGSWLEERFKSLGLAPAGERGYRQEFPIEVSVRSGASTALAIDGEQIAAERFVPTAFSAPGPVEAEVVAAGWGIVAPEKEYDDYAGIDVRGKIVLVRRFVPETEAFRGTEVERRFGDLRFKAFTARERGAIGFVISDLAGERVDPSGRLPPEAPLPRLLPESSADVGIPVIVVERRVGQQLLAGGRRARLAVELVREHAPAWNVVGRLDPLTALKDEQLVVVGAHYDHLGRGGAGSLEPGSNEIHNGADDNASGVAALLEAARLLAERRAELARPVLFVAFAGEERGLLGSNRLVRQPPPGIAASKMAAMINLDMVGRLRNETLNVVGVDTAEAWPAEVEAACAGLGLQCNPSPGGVGPSDHSSFYLAGVPVLLFFTGVHGDYHRPSDDAGAINATGGARIAALTADLLLRVANRADGLTLRRVPMPPPPGGDLRSFGASLGTIPDYTGSGASESGMLLAGVRPGGPAEKAGLRRGDRIVAVGGREVRGVEDLMFVLRQAHPGDEATVVVLRDGERLELPVVFGESTRR